MEVDTASVAAPDTRCANSDTSTPSCDVNTSTSFPPSDSCLSEDDELDDDAITTPHDFREPPPTVVVVDVVVGFLNLLGAPAPAPSHRHASTLTLLLFLLILFSPPLLPLPPTTTIIFPPPPRRSAFTRLSLSVVIIAVAALHQSTQLRLVDSSWP